MSHTIEVRNISKQFRSETVLQGVSAFFDEAQIHGIVGRNGSGKSMLFKTIVGLVKPTEGEVIVHGKRIGIDVDFARDVGLLINAPGFLPHLTAYQNLKLLADIRGVINKEIIVRTIERVGLGHIMMRKRVGKFSMGMRQRLGIAQAIMEDNPVLILDEPLSGLDDQGVREMRTLFQELRDEGKTILLSSHNSEDISLLCETVHRMEQGRIRNQ